MELGTPGKSGRGAEPPQARGAGEEWGQGWVGLWGPSRSLAGLRDLVPQQGIEAPAPLRLSLHQRWAGGDRWWVRHLPCPQESPGPLWPVDVAPDVSVSLPTPFPGLPGSSLSSEELCTSGAMAMLSNKISRFYWALIFIPMKRLNLFHFKALGSAR